VGVSETDAQGGRYGQARPGCFRLTETLRSIPQWPDVVLSVPVEKPDQMRESGGEEMRSTAAHQTQKWKIKASARSSCDCDGSVLLDKEKGRNTRRAQMWDRCNEI
jgi:hypothetical protein